MSKLIPPLGPFNSPIWIIGHAPDQQSESEGKPFSGAAGQLLKTRLTQMGQDVTQVHFDNLLNFRPPKNDFTVLEQSTEGLNQIKARELELTQQILTYQPNIIVCLGAKVLKYLMHLEGIGEWRGHLVWCKNLNTKCIAMFHPSDVLRQRFAKKSDYPGHYDALFQFDIKKAVLNARNRELTFPVVKPKIKPSYQEAREYLHWILEEAELVSYDIENLRGFVVDCIGLAVDRENAICLPFIFPTSHKYMPYYGTEESLELFSLVKQILESEIPKVAQNSQYDTVVLREYYGIKVRNLTWDTLVAAHCLYCELPKDLGTLISFYTDLPYHKYLMSTGKQDDRWIYNALDALANVHIMHSQKAEMTEMGILEHYYKIPHPAIMCCVEMQLRGIEVDTNLCTRAIAQQEAIQTRIMHALDSIFPERLTSNKKDPHKFNPGSWQQKAKLFYEMFQCRIRYNKGKPTTDEDALLKIQEDDKRSFVKILTQACMDFKSAQYLAAKLSTPLKNGRMHCAYDVTGTDTGRLNSKESLFGTGTNLQNLSKGIQRRMLRAN